MKLAIVNVSERKFRESKGRNIPRSLIKRDSKIERGSLAHAKTTNNEREVGVNSVGNMYVGLNEMTHPIRRKKMFIDRCFELPPISTNLSRTEG